jgi:hypothetical protein
VKLGMDPTPGLASADVAKAYGGRSRGLAPGSYPRPSPARKIFAAKLCASALKPGLLTMRDTSLFWNLNNLCAEGTSTIESTDRRAIPRITRHCRDNGTLRDRHASPASEGRAYADAALVRAAARPIRPELPKLRWRATQATFRAAKQRWQPAPRNRLADC